MEIFKEMTSAHLPFKLKNEKFRIYNDTIITNAGETAISLTNCQNIQFKNCVFVECDGEGISITDCQNIEIINCHFENVRTAIYAVNSHGIRIINCYCKNILGNAPRMQFVYFARVFDAHISKCIVINQPGKSHVGNIIDINASGSTDEPILIEKNYIEGCGSHGHSSGGILLGNKGGQAQQARENIIINTGQYGIGCAGGIDIKICDNIIQSQSYSFSNVGIYVWKQNNAPLDNIEISGNKVSFINSFGKSNGWLNGSTSANMTMRDNDWNAKLDALLPPEDYGVLKDSPNDGVDFEHSETIDNKTLTIRGHIKNNKIISLNYWHVETKQSGD